MEVDVEPEGVDSDSKTTSETVREVTSLRELDQQDVLAPFLRPEFDEAKYTAQAILQSSTGTLEKLTKLILTIDQQIRFQVVRHEDGLVQQTIYINTIQTKLGAIAARIKILSDIVHRIKIGLLTPFQKIEALQRKLTNMQMTCETLRQCLRVWQLIERLKIQIGSSLPEDDQKDEKLTPIETSEITIRVGRERELQKAASSLQDIYAVFDEIDLSGIHVIDQNLPFLKRAGEHIKQEGYTMLMSAIEKKNESSIAQALQIFYNLGSDQLTQRIETCLSTIRDKVLTSIKRMLDISSLNAQSKSRKSVGGSDSSSTSSTGASTSSLAFASTWRTALWERVEAFNDDFFNYLLTVWTLEGVLQKQRDAASGILFMDLVRQTFKGMKSEDQTLLEMFWKDIINLLAKELELTMKGSSFAKNVFINEYPRLAKNFYNLFMKIHGHCLNASGQPVLKKSCVSDLLNTFSGFERGFLSRSLGKLHDALVTLFAPKTVPQLSEVQQFIRALNVALEQVRDCPAELQVSVAHGVSKHVLLFASNSESLLDVRSILFPPQVSPKPSSGAHRNAQVYNIVRTVQKEFHSSSLSRSHPTLPKLACNEVEKGWDGLDHVSNEILSQLFQSVLKQLEPTIWSMHDDDYSRLSTTAVDGSPHIQKLRQQINCFVTVYLPLYQATTDSERQNQVFKHLQSLTRSIVYRYSFSISLLPNLHEKGKLKLTADIAQLEGSLYNFVPKRQTDSYQKLGWIKDLLFADSIEKIIEITESKEFDLTLMCNYLFSSCGISLSAPNKVLGLSVGDYARRLEGLPEAHLHELFRKVYQNVELKISIPKGVIGKNYVTKTYPRLALIPTLLPKPTSTTSLPTFAIPATAQPAGSGTPLATAIASVALPVSSSVSVALPASVS